MNVQPHPRVIEMTELLAHITATLAAHRLSLDAAAADPELSRAWDAAQPETRAGLLLSFAWETRAGTLPTIDREDDAHRYAVELRGHANAYPGDGIGFLGRHWPDMPLPGPAGALASSLGFDREDTEESLLTMLLLVLAGYAELGHVRPVAPRTLTFTLTESQLATTQFAIERCFAEFLEHAAERSTPPDEFTRTYVDAFMDVCQVFGVEIPHAPE